MLNLPFLLISFISGYERPIFNIDIIILASIIFKFRRAYFLAIFYFIAEVITYILNIYDFMTISDLLYLAQFFKDLPFFYQIQILLLGAAFSFLCYFSKKINKPFKTIFSILLILYLGLFITLKRELYFSPFFYLYENFDYHRLIIRDNIKNSIEENPYHSLYDTIKKSNGDKVLVILNESWGVTNDRDMQAKILSPLTSKIKNYKLGEEFFIGGTGIAEFRELCSFRPANVDVQKITDFKEHTSNCIPNLFQKKGYHTISLHGAKLDLYDRKYWYPLVGFQKSLHKENLPEMQKCGLFDGYCDHDTIKKVLIPLLKNNEKSFIHYVTLDTHTPYNKKIGDNHLNCNLSEESCRNLNLQYEFFTEISNLTNQVENIDIFIIGDHQPPISNKSESKRVFKKDTISWIYFSI